RFVQEESIAEELVQEVFAWIWENREHLQITEKLRPYLYKAVKNHALNFLKHHKLEVKYNARWSENYKDFVIQAPSELESEQLRLEKIRNIIGQAIEDLPPRSKMTYKLHRFDGLTYQEIADVMNISVKTVESQMTRTLQILRKRLANILPLLFVLLVAG
ncbi:MAG: RNA polymerase sigma-70 factor, partial [Bacteroidota bacterium]